MIVCSCNVISDRTIRSVVDRTVGCQHPAYRIYHSLGYKPQCGRCVRSIKNIILEELADVADQSRAAAGALPNAPPDEPAEPAEEVRSPALQPAE